ncbi:hypothetical protein LINPERPRIM_LOCUS3706 [Linum perenne]
MTLTTQNKQNYKKKCGERGSNTRPADLQYDALPTELSPLLFTIFHVGKTHYKQFII